MVVVGGGGRGPGLVEGRVWRPELAPLRGDVGGTLGPEDLPLSRAPPGRRRESLSDG